MGSIAIDTTITATPARFGASLSSSPLSLSLVLVVILVVISLIVVLLGDLRGSFGDRPGEASNPHPEAGSA
ncbi:MAG: hypothetical protein JNG85_09720 [Spirochaetaceae bacterium]|nr:hypothetical protein [Spirochaetaceae bacterium]